VIAAAVLGGLLALAGCGSGGSSGETSGGTKARTTTTTAPPKYHGDANSPFCDAVRAYKTTLVALDRNHPDVAKRQMADQIRTLRAAQAISPPEIVPEMKVAVGVAELQDRLLEHYGYSVTNFLASPDARRPLAEDEVAQLRRAHAYFLDVCHVDADTQA
jgi:hypothetical protein